MLLDVFTGFFSLQEDKCPSGCHLEGLINLADEDILKRLRNICERIQENQDVTSSVMQKSVQFYGSQRKAIIQTYSMLNIIVHYLMCFYI